MDQTMHHFKKRFVSCGIFLLSVVILIGGLTGCGNKKPIKVGFVGCLTGRLSDLGIGGRNGVMLAVEQINEQGGIHGRPVELLIKDDQHDPDVALQVDKELIQEDVVAIIGHMTSTISIAVVPFINEEKIVMISPTTSTNKLTGIDDYFFRIVPDSTTEAEHLAHHLFKEIGARKMAIVYDLSNQVFTEEWYRNFKTDFESLGGKLSFTATFTSGQDVSYPELSQEILKTNPDGLVIIAGALDTAMICQQLKKLGSDLLVVCSGWSKAPDLIQHGGSAVEGVLFSLHYNTESQHSDYVTFKQQFHERFEREADLGAVFGYETAQLLLKVLSETTDREKIKETILRLQAFKGLQGEINIDQYGDPKRTRFLAIVKDGQFKTME